MTPDWQSSRLASLFGVKHGLAFKGEFFASAGEHILLTPGNFGEGGGLIARGEREKYYIGSFPQEYLLNEGDLLIAMTDLTQHAPILGSAAFVPKSGRYLHNQRLGKVVDLRGHLVTPTFLLYLLNSEGVRAQIRATATGSTVRHTAPSRIGDVVALIPPLSIQACIASIPSAYDDLIENCQRRIRILEDMARGLYREWFVHFRFPGADSVPRVDSPLGPIPQGWQVCRLDEVLVLQRGFDLPKGERSNGSVPIYASSGITGFHNEAKVRAPGVVTGRSGTIGEVLYVQEDFWPLNTTLWVKAFPKSEPLFAYYLLGSLDLKQFNSGAAVPTLNRNDVHGIAVAVPPQDLQQRFQRIAGSMLEQVRALTMKCTNLRRTRNLLLPRLLSGQIALTVEPGGFEQAQAPSIARALA